LPKERIYRHRDKTHKDKIRENGNGNIIKPERSCSGKVKRNRRRRFCGSREWKRKKYRTYGNMTGISLSPSADFWSTGRPGRPMRQKGGSANSGRQQRSTHRQKMAVCCRRAWNSFCGNWTMWEKKSYI